VFDSFPCAGRLIMARAKRGFGFARQLTKMIDKLKEQRQKHADALRAVDAIFEGIGIPTHFAEKEEAPRRGRPPGKRGPGRPPGTKSTGKAAKKKGRKGRGRFATSGSESILAFVRKAGSKGVMGAEIGNHWKAEGRGAGVYVVVGKLV